MIFLSALILAQSTFTYSDGKGDLSIRSRDGQGQVHKDGWEFRLRGGVQINSRKKGFLLNAADVRAVIARSKASASPDELKTATATGGVKLSQTAKGRTANLQSNSATYTAAGSGALVKAAGSVRLQNVDQAKRETMVATGSSGTATLDPNSKSGVSSATLNGPVRVEVVQTSDKSSKMVFTGNKLTLKGDRLTLAGNVKATGSGASQLGSFSNLNSVTVKLNDKGEFVSFSFDTGRGE